MVKRGNINIIVSAQMGKGTFEAKIVPLSMVENISNIYVLRKSPGPSINKVHYLIIPKIFHYSLFKIFIPFILAKKAKKHQCELILSYHFIPHAFYAYIASILSGIPFNISQTGSYIHKYYKRRSYKWLINKCLKRALFINVPGEKSYSQWVSTGVNKEKINILHSTVDTNSFKNNSLEKKYDIIFIGRLHQVKQVDQILEAVAHIIKTKFPNLKCAIIGSGPEEKTLRELAEKLEIEKNIHFLGFRNDTAYLLNISKVFVMYSSSEGLPLALMEAMACEKTVIASNVGNISSLIDNNINGFLVSPIRTNELIEKIIVALSNQTDDSMGANARKEIITNHSLDSAIEKWKEIFNNIYFEKN